MKNKKWPRLFSAILSVCIVMAMMPLAVFAEERTDIEQEEYGLVDEETELELLEEELQLELLAEGENFKVDNAYYETLEDAVTAAGTKGTVVMVGESYVLNADLTIPSGVTLLLPYGTSTKIYPKAGFFAQGQEYSNSTCDNNNPSNVISTPENSDPEHCLIVAEDVTLTIEAGAKLVLGGQYSGGAGGHMGGQTCGPHSDMILKSGSNLIVKGILSTMGYITGDGFVEVIDGGTVYEPFVVNDFHGGSYTIVMYMGANPQTPFNSFSMFNIQCSMTIDSSSKLYGYCNLYAMSKHNFTSACVIGAEDALLLLGEGTEVTFDYDPNCSLEDYYCNGVNIGRTTVTVNGDATFGSMDMTIYGKKVATEDVAFPVAYNLHFVQETGTLTVGNPVKILPGGKVEIGEEADLVLVTSEIDGKLHEGKLLVFDGLVVPPYSGGSSVMYPDGETLSSAGMMERGQLVVSGTMEIQTDGVFAGVVENNGTGKIVVDEDAGLLNAIVVEGAVRGDTPAEFDNFSFSSTTKTSYDLIGKVGKYNVYGDYLLLEAGNTYYAMDDDQADNVESYVYTAYDDSNTPVEREVDYQNTQTITGTWTMLDLVMNKSKQHVEFRCGDKDFDGSVIIASYAGGKLQKTIVNNYDGCKEESISFAALVDEDTTIVRAFLLDGNYAPLSEVVYEEFTR